jgi:HD-like signal output (HDOD) protein
VDIRILRAKLRRTTLPLTITLAVLGFLVFGVAVSLMLRAQASGRGSSAAPQRRRSPQSDPPPRETVPRRGLSKIPEDFAGTVTVVDSSSQVMPSPERPPTEVDAVFIDLIRQAMELPSALLELSQLLRREDVQVRQVTELVGTDPVLSARLLRVANSAAVGRGKISSLQKAVVLLGFNQVWILVNQMLTSRSIQSVGAIDANYMKALWMHAATSATCAKHIMGVMGKLGTPEAPSTLTCALLHDVGKFFLKGVQGGAPPEKNGDEHQPLETAPIILENQEHGIDHCRVAFLLTTYWKLPDEICASVSYHHHPAFANHASIPENVRNIVNIVALSDYMANILGYYDSVPMGYAIPDRVFAEIGLRKSVSELITRDLRKELKRTAALIESASEIS